MSTLSDKIAVGEGWMVYSYCLLLRAPTLNDALAPVGLGPITTLGVDPQRTLLCLFFTDIFRGYAFETDDDLYSRTLK